MSGAERLRSSERPSLRRCPACHGELGAEESTLSCQEGHAAIHLECAELAPTCPALGCELRLGGAAEGSREDAFTGHLSELRRLEAELRRPLIPLLLFGLGGLGAALEGGLDLAPLIALLLPLLAAWAVSLRRLLRKRRRVARDYGWDELERAADREVELRPRRWQVERDLARLGRGAGLGRVVAARRGERRAVSRLRLWAIGGVSTLVFTAALITVGEPALDLFLALGGLGALWLGAEGAGWGFRCWWAGGSRLAALRRIEAAAREDVALRDLFTAALADEQRLTPAEPWSSALRAEQARWSADP